MSEPAIDTGPSRAFRDPAYRPLATNLGEVRANIDRLDDAIVALIAERAMYVKDAARFKRDAHQVSAPARQAEVFTRVRRLAEKRDRGFDQPPDVVEATYRAMELIKAKTGTFIVHIPYASSPAAVTSVIAGDTQIASLAPLALMPQVQAGRLKALAISTPQRSPLLPGIPTFREAGILDVEASAWIGMVAPAKTPQVIIERLNREFVAAMRDPAVAERLKAIYMTPDPGTPAQFAAFMQEELKRWAPVIRRSGATVD